MKKAFSGKIYESKKDFAVTTNLSYMPKFFKTKREAVLSLMNELKRWGNEIS